MAKTVVIFNQKGGVGKTSTAVNLGAELAAKGRRVLLVDADPQGSAGSALGLDPDTIHLTLYNLLVAARDATDESPLTADAVRAGIIEIPGGLHLLPANETLADADIDFVQEIGRERLLAEVLAPIGEQYDYILIDCAPYLGLLAIIALTAATHILMPVPPKFLDAKGMARLLLTIKKIRRRSNPQVQVAGIVYTLGKARRRHQTDMREQIRGFCETQRPPIAILGEIPDATAVESAAQEGIPLRQYDPRNKATLAYEALAEQLIQRLED